MADPRETSFYVDPTKRSIVLPGLAADKIYNLAVRGYRRVDKDISASGVIFSELTRAKSWRYQPSTTVAFNGDVTGTIQGVASSQVIADLVGLTSDGVLSRGEKATFALAYTQMAATYDAASSKSVQLGGTDSQRSAAFAAVNALNDYLGTLRPAWNDMTVDTPIDPDTFRAAWATVQATVADLQAAVTDRASQLAKWTGVTGPGKPQDNATVGAPVGTNVGDVPVTSIVDAVKGLDGSVLKIRDVSSQVADARTAAAAASSEAAAARQDVVNAKADLKVSIDAAQRDASSARSEAAQVGSDLAKARSDLSTAVSAAQGDATAARTDISQARSDLAAEVQRAKEDTSAIRRDIVDVKQTADGAASSIRDEAAIRSRDDSALASRIQTVEADYTTKGQVDNRATVIANAKVAEEASARADADAALSSRSTKIEASVAGVSKVVANDYFDNGVEGWTLLDGVAVVPSSYGRSSVIRTQPGVKYNEVRGRKIPITSDKQRFKLKASWRCAAAQAVYYFGVVFYDADGNHVGASDGTGNYPLGPSLYLDSAIHGWLDREVVIGKGNPAPSPYGGTTAIPAAAVYFRQIIFINYTDIPGSVTEIDYFAVEDVTEAVATNALIADEATTRATTDTALSGRLSTTEAKLNGDQDSTLAARIRNEATASTNRDSALGQRVDSVIAQANTDRGDLNTRIANEATASANRDAAIGSRTQTLESTAARLNDMALKSFPGFDVQADGWGYDTQLRGRNNGSAWETHHIKGAGIAFPPGFGDWLYMDPFGWIKTTPGKRYRAGFWVWQWSAPNGYGGRPRLYWEGQNKDHSDGIYLGATSGIPEETVGWYQPLPNGAWHCYGGDIQVDDAITSGANSYWIRPRINIDSAPSGAGYVIAGWFCREVTGEFSNAAKISDEATTRANQDSALGNRISTTEAQMRGDQDSWLAARVRDEATASSNRDGALGSRLQTVESNYVTNAQADAKVSAEATTRAGETGSLANRIGSVETRYDGAGNLVTNSELLSLDGWQITSQPAGTSFDRNGGGADWNIVGENSLTIGESGTASSLCEIISAPVSVTGGQYVQGYALGASHRSNNWVSIFFYKNDGSWNGYAGENYSPRYNNGGRDMSGWDQTGVKSVRVPDGTATMRLALRKYPTRDNEYGSIAWFIRPYLGYARQGQTEWNPYSPGSGKASIAAANARISDEATASANRDGAISQRVDTTEAKLRGDQDSGILAAIRDETTTRATQVGGLSSRVGTVEAKAKNVAISFTAVSKGNSTVAKFGKGSGIYNVDGGNFTGGGRGFRVSVFDANNTMIASNVYDTLGGLYSGGAGNMANFLNGITEGQAVIITTDDEPQSNRLTGGLVEAMERCGAGPLFSSPKFAFRGAYILVGQAGIGKGNGNEYYSGTGDSAPDAWIEARFDLLNGRPQLNGAGKAIAETNAAIKDEAAARSDAVGAVASRIGSVEASYTAGGNLLSNTDLAYDMYGWNYGQETATGGGRDAFTPNSWWPAGLHAMVIAQENNNGNRAGYFFQEVWGIEAGKNYQATVYGASHRCAISIYIDCYDSLGNFLGTTESQHIEYAGNDNYAPLTSWRRHKLDFVTPANTSRLRYHLMKYGTTSGGNSYAWFIRPQLVQTRPGFAGTVPYVPGSGDMGNLAANSRISDEATTRSNADGALSGRISTTEAQLNGSQGSWMAGRINDVDTASANRDSALAQRATTLESAALVGGSSARNDHFAMWRDGQQHPDNWIVWNAEGNYRTERVNGNGGSPYAVRTLNDNANVESGFYQQIPVYAGKWIVEVTAESDGSGFSGAGMTLHGVFNIDFLSDPDTKGYTGDQVNTMRTWNKAFDFDQNFINNIGGTVNFHAMHGWAGFGRYRAPKYMKWHKMSLRPAGYGDAESFRANARITDLATTTANADSALSNRISSTEASYNSVRNDLNTWNNDRYNQAVAIDARVAREETARADAISAVANRTSVVEAQVSNDSNNLVRNGTFNAPGWARGGGIPPYWGGWSQDNGAYIGTTDRTSMYGAPYPLQIDRNGINNGITQRINGPLAPGWYAFEVDVVGEDGNWSGSGIHCNFNNGSVLTYGFATNADTAGRYGDIGNTTRRFTVLFKNEAQSDGANIYLMSGWEGFQGRTNFGFVRIVWHRIVMRPATAGEIKAQQVDNLSARVSTTESAVSNLNGRTASYWQVQSVAGNNRAQLTVRADANGGAGVDIVGDVRFAGGNANGTCIVNGNGLNLYYANGQQAVRLSI